MLGQLVNSFSKSDARSNQKLMILTALAGMLAVAPLDFGQLACLFCGGLWFALMQAVPSTKKKKTVVGDEYSPKSYRAPGSMSRRYDSATSQARMMSKTAKVPRTTAQADLNELPKCMPTASPIEAPSFQSDDFGQQVSEMLTMIAPTANDDKLIEKVSKSAERILKQFFSEVEVSGFVNGNFRRAQSYAVAVPEVDIVASVSPYVLRQATRRRGTNRRDADEAMKCLKSALRSCTDILVTSGGFKFRRSAFKCYEPKVTLLAPPMTASDGSQCSFPVDFLINCATPLYNATLMTECGQIDARGKELILLVRRWAKDRAICHAAQGYWPPYAWTLLVMYFLQVGTEDKVLPSLEGFDVASSLMTNPGASAKAPGKVQNGAKTKTLPSDKEGGQALSQEKKSTATLFKDFMNFYTSDFKWSKECVCVRTGERAAPSLSMNIEIIEAKNGTTQVAPCIEDPFTPSCNLAQNISWLALTRVQEEFARANTLCQQGSTLLELLEPWKPPNTDDSSDKGKNDSDEQDS